MESWAENNQVKEIIRKRSTGKDELKKRISNSLETFWSLLEEYIICLDFPNFLEVKSVNPIKIKSIHLL